MPLPKPKTKSPRFTKKQITERQKRVDRGQKDVENILRRENLVLSVNRIQLYEKKGDRLVPAGELTPSAVACMLGLPEGSTVMPLVEMIPGASPNGQNAG